MKTLEEPKRRAAQPGGLAPVHGSAIWFRSVGDSVDVLHGEMAEELRLVETRNGVGLVKNTLSFMGEEVDTLWAIIGSRLSLPEWKEQKPDWPNAELSEPPTKKL